jgi:hypothetical protein
VTLTPETLQRLRELAQPRTLGASPSAQDVAFLARVLLELAATETETNG